RGVEPQRPVAACGEPGGQVAAGFQQRQDVFQRIHRAPLARLRKWTMTKAFRTLAHRSSSPVILAWPVSRRPRREHDMAADDTRRTTTPFTRDATAEEVLEGIDLRGRRAVVTGGASGLGAETVRALAAAGADVTIATRRPQAAARLLADLVARSARGRVRVARLDLADLSSVRRFVDAWEGPLDALVANAGILALPERTLTPYGWELQQATNYLGHVALATGLR